MKQKLRKEILAKRKERGAKIELESNKTIVQRTQNLLDGLVLKKINEVNGSLASKFVDKVSVVGLYWPMQGEPDLRGLFDSADKKFALPKVKGSKMVFVSYSKGQKLEQSEFGKLMQPASGDEVEPNIVIIPGLAFGKNGARLGFGVGHYDRYFAGREGVLKIGVCFHDDLYEEIPMEDHDLEIDYILTNKTVIKL